ncbi:MAG TPA: DUF3572 domain-containing protein [Rhizomicrobium sp.]|jgi:hypothetical protein|nr:DUF3572 domain-containing protein [Rhizomicrobium sp.]
MALKQTSQAASAETIGIKGIVFLGMSEDDLQRFIDQSGLDPADLRARAGEPEVLVAVLDYLLADDTRLTGFCEAEGLTPRAVHMARHQLSGG